MGEKIDAVRLKRSDLDSATYRQLIQSLFVKGQVDHRIRYARWLFEENCALKNDEQLPIYLCSIDSNAVGQLAIIPVEISLAGRPIRGGWCVDFYVNPHFQRRGIGIKLLNAAYQDFPVLMTLGQTDSSFDLFVSKFGWHHEDYRLTSYKSFLRTHLLVKYLFKKMGLLKTKEEPRSLPQKKYEPPGGVLFRSMDSFENITDPLNCQDEKDPKAAMVLRTPAFLEWRYIRHPFIKYNLNHIRPTRCCDIYVVWRMVHDDFWRRAALVDILYENGTPVTAMKIALKALMQCASFYGAQIFECQTTDQLVLKALPDSLLSVKKPAARFLYGMQNMAECPLIPISQWKLYAGDCDLETLDFEKST
ncbi:MAG: GNAT family N-acetyltransferase [Desulfobacterales bacterium]|nr:GNAT family N-acetyltransferase [Desulfobacterales bacterium]